MKKSKRCFRYRRWLAVSVLFLSLTLRLLPYRAAGANEPAPVTRSVDDGSESVLLEALSSEITESLSSGQLSADVSDLDEFRPPVIADPAPDDAESGSSDGETSAPDLAAALAPLLWFIAALLLALFAVLLFR